MEKARFHEKCIDFINVFKAFIGSNYLSMPFAFHQSGIIFGAMLLIIIGGVAGHCCHKIVICKQMIISRLMARLELKQGLLPNEKSELCRKLKDQCELYMTLSNVAKYVYGRKGLWLVSISLFILQFGFCTGYFIFIGNTLQELLYQKTVNGSHQIEIISSSEEVLDLGYQVPLAYLIMVAMPLFAFLSLLRSVRNIGWVSAFGILTVAFGYFSILGIILNSFSISTEFSYIKFSTLPMVFGLLTSNFEGIGTIIPVESSMVGNRHNYPKYLHISISLVIVILGSFGTLGYLQFGEKTQQIFPQNLSYTVFISVVNSVLIIGAICTYPLQMFPVIEIAEILIFRKTLSISDREFSQDSNESTFLLAENEIETRDNQTMDKFNHSHQRPSVSTHFSDNTEPLEITERKIDRIFTKKDERMIKIIYESKIKAPAWKRNLLRVALVLVQMGLAVVMKDNYAYLISFVGAIGGSFLLYIVPAAAHYKLCSESGESQYRGCVDICIVIFGILGAVISFVVSVINLI